MPQMTVKPPCCSRKSVTVPELYRRAVTDLKGEQPSPSCPAGDAAHLENAGSKEGGEDSSDVECRPEEAETDGQLSRGVEVGAEQNSAWNETSFEGANECTSDAAAVISQMPNRGRTRGKKTH